MKKKPKLPPISTTQVVEVMRRHQVQLMSLPDVSAVLPGSGCIVVHAVHRRDRPLNAPKSFEGVPIKVNYIGSGDQPLPMEAVAPLGSKVTDVGTKTEGG